MKKNKSVDTTVMIAAVIGSLVLLNILGIKLFGRLDLTQGKEFTLSQASRDILRDLKDPVTITAYFTKDLPPPYSTNARYIKDLLEEYYSAADGNLRFEFIDPVSTETEADKATKKDVKQDIFGNAVREETSVEKELREVGIPPVKVRVNQDDKLEIKRAYMGIAIRFADKKEVIPVVQDTNNLEYELTTMIRKVTRSRAPKIGYLSGHDAPNMQKDMSRINDMLGPLYDIEPIDLSQKNEIPDDVDALLVVGPKSPLSQDEQKTIDKFVMSGKGAAFLLGAVQPELQKLQANPVQHGMAPMLEKYGVKIGDGLVLDAECATMSVQQQRGFMRISQPVQYPYIPVPRSLDPDNPLTRGLAKVSFPFVSPLSVSLPEDSAVKAEVLAKSSKQSWVVQPPYDLNPMQKWDPSNLGLAKARNLIISLRGPIPSAFADPSAAGMSTDPAEATPKQAEDGRILVVGGNALVMDQYMSEGNQTLVLNMMDWLVLDEALLAVRSRGMSQAPLDEISDGGRNAVKYGNILGLPLAFIAFGLFRWRSREGRRSKAVL